MKRLREHPKVMEVEFDQCRFGLKDPVSEMLYRKGTRIMTTNEIMVQLLNKKCLGDHDHERLEGKIRIGGKWVNRTMCAQVYPKSLVETMVKAIRIKRNHEQRIMVGNYPEILVAEPLKGVSEKMGESI